MNRCDDNCACNDGKIGCFSFAVACFVLLMLIMAASKWIRQVEERVDKLEQSRPK